MQSTPNRIRSPKVGPGPGLQQTGLSKRGLSLVFLAVVGVAVAAPASGAIRVGQPLASFSGIAAEASADDLRMTVTAATDRVSSGGELQLAVSVHNAGASRVSIASWECGAPIAVEATLGAPSNPGRDLADPLEAELRALAVVPNANAVGSGVITRPSECAIPDDKQTIGDQELAPGQALSATTPWSAELVDGVPAPTGDATLTVRVAYREAGKAQAPYKPLVATTKILVSEGEKAPISATQALDAVLDEEAFSAWLRAAPSSSWTSANVFLQNLGPGNNGIVPDGPSWEVDVFRTVDGARQWAISFVDPATGQVRSVNLCERECGTTAQ